MSTVLALITCLTLTVVDGDTVKCDGQNLRPIGDGKVNVNGFDTPEPKGRSQCLGERMLATLAKQRMAELIRTPGLFIEDSGELDYYKRPLVVLRLVDGTTIGQTLINEGYAVEWRKGRKVDWCGIEK